MQAIQRCHQERSLQDLGRRGLKPSVRRNLSCRKFTLQAITEISGSVTVIKNATSKIRLRVRRGERCVGEQAVLPLAWEARNVAEALRELGFELDANQTTVRGKKQPRRWRRPATLDDLGSEEPSEAGQTANGEGDPSDQPRITTQEIDLRVGKLLEGAPVMGAASERGLNTPKPLVGSGFDVTSDDSRSERKKHTIPPLNLDCPF